MNIIKYIFYLILMILSSFILLMIGGNIINYIFTIKNIFFMLLSLGIASSLLMGLIMFLGTFISARIYKLNKYEWKGKLAAAIILGIISLVYIGLNLINLNFEYTRSFFAISIIGGLALYVPVSLFMGDEN